jgi:hypothetical protein
MKGRSFLIAMTVMLLFLQCNAFADAEIHDRIGTYNMNHDG